MKNPVPTSAKEVLLFSRIAAAQKFFRRKRVVSQFVWFFIPFQIAQAVSGSTAGCAYPEPKDIPG